MKRIAIAIALMIMVSAAYAYCTTQTYIGPNGQIVICSVCCDTWGNCTTTCY